MFNLLVLFFICICISILFKLVVNNFHFYISKYSKFCFHGVPICRNKIQLWFLKCTKTCGIIVTCPKAVLSTTQFPNFATFFVPVFAKSDHFSVWSHGWNMSYLINYDYDIANHFVNLAKMLHPPGKLWPQSLTLMNFASFSFRERGVCGCTFKVNTFFLFPGEAAI